MATRRPASLAAVGLASAAHGALESLLSATVADGMTVGQRHDPDRELFGRDLANIVRIHPDKRAGRPARTRS
jgi:MFS superfamily sulfate permease-like transporter